MGKPILTNRVVDMIKEVGTHTLSNLHRHNHHMEGDSSKGATIIDMAPARRQAAEDMVSSLERNCIKLEVTLLQSEAMTSR